MNKRYFHLETFELNLIIFCSYLDHRGAECDGHDFGLQQHPRLPLIRWLELLDASQHARNNTGNIPRPILFRSKTLPFPAVRQRDIVHHLCSTGQRGALYQASVQRFRIHLPDFGHCRYGHGEHYQVLPESETVHR